MPAALSPVNPLDCSGIVALRPALPPFGSCFRGLAGFARLPDYSSAGTGALFNLLWNFGQEIPGLGVALAERAEDSGVFSPERVP
jgi:hypothetical protein